MFDLMEIPPRYNIGPRQQVLAVRQEDAERPKKIQECLDACESLALAVG
jgi:hypothetical protein